MVLEVIHYYTVPSNIDIDKGLKQGMFIIVTTSTFFLSNCVIAWQLNNGKLYICEIYSKHDKTYEKSYVNQILEDDNKVFHDWLNCEILAPGYLIPGNIKVDGYFSIKIKNGCVEDVKFKTILEEYNQQNMPL
ncbi:hypothetical protein ACKW6Q_09200 [Chryseobacterium kwangjuense]|uniref:Uncharacterized protein n=1 Tax=Chryseobacterium kwangjuense TaxID=267125 RepID=A0ABW9K3W7_9FLAO